jgi:hypothetical protein
MFLGKAGREIPLKSHPVDFQLVERSRSTMFLPEMGAGTFPAEDPSSTFVSHEA